jgi:hypothetical protein
LRAECFSCSLDIGKFAIFDQKKIKKKFSAVFFQFLVNKTLDPNPDSLEIRISSEEFHLKPTEKTQPIFSSSDGGEKMAQKSVRVDCREHEKAARMSDNSGERGVFQEKTQRKIREIIRFLVI